jgi:nicotinate phosphoribosyltransferase
MSFSDEKKAFEAFIDTFPQGCVLLVDTYDTLRSGVPNAIEVFRKRPDVPPAIRIDSGDLAKLSKAAYRQFAAAGLPNVNIIGTNDLDEDLIADLKRQGAKINMWAVGTHLITSKDHPALDGVYKLVAMEQNSQWIPRIKLSGNPEKTTDPGLKQVVRCYNADQAPVGDLMIADNEPLPTGPSISAIHRQYLYQDRHLHGVERVERLLQPLFQNGRRIQASPKLEDIRNHARKSIAAFPEEYLRLRNPEIYWLGLSPELGRMKQSAMEKAQE